MMKIVNESENIQVINPQFAPRKNIEVLQKSLKNCVNQGIRKRVGVSYVSVAANGRSFLISDTTYRLELCGYFPAESPKYTIMVMLEKEGLPHSSTEICGYILKNSIDGICSILLNISLEDEQGVIQRYYPNEYLRNLQTK